MADTLKHKTQYVAPTKVLADPNWNEEHTFAGGALGSLLFRDTGTSDGANWLADVATGSVLVSGGVGAAPAWSTSPTLSTLAIGTNPAGLSAGNKLMEVGGWDGSNWVHLPNDAEIGIAFWPSSTTSVNDSSGYVIGFDAAMYVRGTADTANAYGITGAALQVSTGTLGLAVGIFSAVSKSSGGGSINQAICFEGGPMLYGEQWARGVVIHSGTAPVENTAFWTDQVAGANNYAFRSVGDAKSALGGALTVAGGITHGSATLLTTSIALTNGAAANTGTLTNAPSVGNPTKWIPINDNGTTRHIPAW